MSQSKPNCIDALRRLQTSLTYLASMAVHKRAMDAMNEHIRAVEFAQSHIQNPHELSPEKKTWLTHHVQTLLTSQKSMLERQNWSPAVQAEITEKKEALEDVLASLNNN